MLYKDKKKLYDIIYYIHYKQTNKHPISIVVLQYLYNNIMYSYSTQLVGVQSVIISLYSLSMCHSHCFILINSENRTFVIGYN